MAPVLQEISYSTAIDSLDDFLKSKGVCFFDSSDRQSAHSVWSICAVLPTHYHELHHKDEWNGALKESIDSTFHSPDLSVEICGREYNLPFNGGWVGVVSYEAAAFFEDFDSVQFAESSFPKMIWVYYPSAVLFHHKSKSAFWVTQNGLSFESGRKEACDNARNLLPFSCKTPKEEILRADYEKGVLSIQNHILDGDIYQGNFTYPVSAVCEGDLLEVYQDLKVKSPAPFSVFIDANSTQICGVSPEEFVHVSGNKIRTRPIKGTIARVTGEADEVQKQRLKDSVKNNAELLMITDLERNDLGRVCKRGSVTVSQLNTVETYSHLHHLVSTVEGELAQPFSIDLLLSTLFPGGSITGAPKIRATEILATLEPNPRNIYTGVVGYVSAKQSHFNISIRTIYRHQGKLFYHVGGGIVADSEWHDEWKESVLKGKGIAETLKKWL